MNVVFSIIDLRPPHGHSLFSGVVLLTTIREFVTRHIVINTQLCVCTTAISRNKRLGLCGKMHNLCLLFIGCLELE